MPYILRDAGSNISGLCANPSSDVSEFLPDDDPQVIAYLIEIDPMQKPLTTNLVQKIKHAFVEAGALTQARADEIFS